MPIVVQRFESMQYDGTNGAELVAWLNGSADLVSDDGSHLVLLYVGSQRTLAVGDWAICGGSGAYRGFQGEMTPDLYAAIWREVTP
ncbi:hypothetical protein [Streptomyces sp. NPDC013740]|uniref:hypothetical protein n=1 Tax=Streptomyces sp. NPDC013740 TaxID=3364867 RepID=UPI0036F8D8E7